MKPFTMLPQHTKYRTTARLARRTAASYTPAKPTALRPPHTRRRVRLTIPALPAHARHHRAMPQEGDCPFIPGRRGPYRRPHRSFSAGVAVPPTSLRTNEALHNTPPAQQNHTTGQRYTTRGGLSHTPHRHNRPAYSTKRAAKTIPQHQLRSLITATIAQRGDKPTLPHSSTPPPPSPGHRTQKSPQLSLRAS